MSSEKEDCLGYAARDPSGFLSPFKFSRRALENDDVSISITHCGVCYAEVLLTRNKFGNAKYPLVPGHEMVGVVKKVGSNVKSVKVGDRAGVGTYVNSCRDCEYCEDEFEVYCAKGRVPTYNHVDVDGTITKGGFCHLHCCSRAEVSKSLDFIIDTASGTHPFDPYMSLLKTSGVLVLVGAPGEVKLSPISLIHGMKSISGSASGGTKDTREMLDFCAANKIYPEIEIIPIQYVNEAIERLIKSDVKYRFVIDIENSLK